VVLVSNVASNQQFFAEKWAACMGPMSSYIFLVSNDDGGGEGQRASQRQEKSNYMCIEG
jgi:hypothetical protein